MPKFDIAVDRNEENIRRILTLTLTRRCNLNCRYCFEDKYPKSQQIMNFDLAKKIISFYMEKDEMYREILIDFFGGEPLLAFPLIQQIVEWVNSKTWNKKYLFSIGTNGTILTDDIKDWMRKNRKHLEVGVSFDGSKKAHDISRDNSYDVVWKNLPFFRENWPNQTIKMTICAETIPFVAESVIEMEEMGLPFTANVIFEDIWGKPNEKKKLLDTYANQLLKLVDYYAAHPNLYPVTLLDRKIEHTRLKNDKPDETVDKKAIKRFCGSGHEMVMVDTDGNKYPCHRFAPWITGRSAPQKKQNHQTQWLPKECDTCKLVSVCPTCVGFNFELNGDSSIRSTFHCEALKLEVLASAKLQAVRIDQNKHNSNKLFQKEPNIMKRRIDAILEITNDGI